MGGHLCRLLVAEGNEVTAVVRRPDSAPSGTRERVVANIDGDTEWSNAFDGQDVVVHLAARVHVMTDSSEDPLAEFRNVNTAGTKRLAESAAAAGVPRLVFLSSIKVNGESTEGEPIRASSAPEPVDPYGISKHEAEQRLREIEDAGGLEVVIIRTPLVYGPGVGGNFLRMLNLAASGLPLPLGAIRNARTMSSIWNLVDLIARSIKEPGIGGATIVAGDPSSISTPEMFRVLSRAMSKRSVLIRIPTKLLILAGRLVGRSAEIARLTGSLEVTAGSGAESWGWQPPVKVENGLAMTAAWFIDSTSSNRKSSK